MTVLALLFGVETSLLALRLPWPNKLQRMLLLSAKLNSILRLKVKREHIQIL
jgi:hypothetical protein